MPKFLIEVKSRVTGESAIQKVSANSSEDALTFVPDDWEVIRIKHTWGGARKGSGKVSQWGDNVQTKVFRLPVTVGENIQEILGTIEACKATLEVWDAKVQDSKDKSGGKVAEKYKYVEQMANKLRQCLKDLPDNII